MRYWWGRYRKQKKNTEGGKMAKDKKRGSPEKRDKRENGRRAKTEQHRAALSSILAQVGSGPAITLTHREGGFFWVTATPFKMPHFHRFYKTHFHTFNKKNRKYGTSDTAAVFFLFHM